MTLIKFTFKDKLLYWIIFFMGCTSFPVLNVAGSLKIYDVLGFILLAYTIAAPSKFNKQKTSNVLAFSFFIVIPICSYLYSIVFLDYPTGFFSRWASSKLVYLSTFKLNYYLFPLFQMLLLAMNYVVFINFTNNNTLYRNFGKILKGAITMGTIISCYSIFASYVYDFIPYLPHAIQAQPVLLGRSRGFSQEPSVYALYQSWITVFVFYSKHLYKKRIWYALFIINGFSLVSSLSSTMIGLTFATLIVFFTTRDKFSKKMSRVLTVLSFVVLISIVVVVLGLQDTMTTYFYDKVFIFLNTSSHDNTATSGAARAFYNALGYKIFANYPLLGVGQGHSQYYMYVYEHTMGIRHWGEKIFALSTPMGVMPLVMAEQGVLGFIALLLFYFGIIKKMWDKRRLSKYHKMFLTGGLFTFVYFFTLFPVYHVFIWAPLGLGLGYIKYFDKLRIEELAQQENKHSQVAITNLEPNKN